MPRLGYLPNTKLENGAQGMLENDSAVVDPISLDSKLHEIAMLIANNGHSDLVVRRRFSEVTNFDLSQVQYRLAGWEKDVRILTKSPWCGRLSLRWAATEGVWRVFCCNYHNMT